MIELIEAYGYGALGIATVVICSVLCVCSVRKWRKGLKGQDQLEVGGHYFSAVGTLYAVILGLVVVDSASKFNEARTNTINEVDAIAEVYALAETMPLKNRIELRSAIQRYVDHAGNEGWRNLQQGIVDVAEEAIFDEIIVSARSIEPRTENQKALFPIMIESLVNASENRESRVNKEHYELPNIEWFSLITGGLATIGFTFFFTIESLVAQAVMTAMVAFVLSLNLYIAYLYDTPYSGALVVKNTPFLNLRDYINLHR